MKKKDNGFIKYDQEKIRYDLVDPEFEEGVAKVLTYGAKKYAPNNWQKCNSVMQYYAALRRHLADFIMREDDDPETGLSHIFNIGCCAMFMYGLLKIHGDKVDDRPKKEAKMNDEYYDTENPKEHSEIIGYCKYCKDEVYAEDELVKKLTGIYHLFCWKQKTGAVDELDFQN